MTRYAHRSVQGNLVACQQRIGRLEGELADTRKRSGLLESELNSVRLGLEVANKAEARANESVASMRAELSKQEALMESVRRIEAGLANQGAEGKTRMAQESKRLGEALAEERKRASAERSLAQSKVTLAEDSLKTAEAAKGEALVGASEAREKLAVSQGEVKTLQEKCVRSSKL